MSEGFLLPDDIVLALNQIGFYHGRASIKRELFDPHEIEDRPSAWEENPFLSPFGGFYATPSRRIARQFAEEVAACYMGEYGAECGIPQVYRVEFLHGAEVALDEDEFTWGNISIAWMEGEQTPWKHLSTSQVIRANLQAIGLWESLNKKIEHIIQEISENEFNFEFDPDWVREDIENWTFEYVRPVLENIYGRWLVGKGFALPRLRILNDKFRLHILEEPKGTVGLPAAVSSYLEEPKECPIRRRPR